jgi:hypothetical protein
MQKKQPSDLVVLVALSLGRLQVLDGVFGGVVQRRRDDQVRLLAGVDQDALVLKAEAHS